MASRVFFSFHYADVATFRANVVRKHSVTKDEGEAGFFDASMWEEARRYGSLKRLINSALDNTSVTCALIGTETWRRPWVRYELLKSYDRGNKLLGVHINDIRDKNGQTFGNGPNPFDFLGLFISKDGRTQSYFERDSIGGEWRNYADLDSKTVQMDDQYRGKGYVLSDWVPTFSWTSQDGYNNFSRWIESAK